MNIIAVNKKAFFDYEITETIEAGMVLTGDEVKSLRNKHITLGDSYAVAHQGKITLLNCHIAPYSHAYSKEDMSSRRSINLLLHKKQINRLLGALSRKGLTLVPLKVYFNDKGWAKIELGLGKHKNAVGKKQALKERDIERETQKELKIRLR